jgi:hypothetical protein
MFLSNVKRNRWIHNWNLNCYTSYFYYLNWIQSRIVKIDTRNRFEILINQPCAKVDLREFLDETCRLNQYLDPFFLDQGWPTQIGLGAATWKVCLKYWLFGPQYTEKLKKYTQNYEKSLILNSRLGRKSFFLGHMRPAGRGLATPVLDQRTSVKVTLLEC